MKNHPDPKSRKSQDVRDMFDRVAPKYDFLNALLSFQIEKKWRKKAVKKMETKHLSHVLDLATGTGPFALQILKKAQRFNAQTRVTGLDFSLQMLMHGFLNKKSQSKQSGYYKESYFPIQGDAQALPFQDQCFTAATIGFGIRNVEHIDKALAETFRVLKSDSVFLILEFSKAPNPFVRAVYNFYFHQVLPRIGGWISKDKSAYTYLPKSVAQFPEPHEFAGMLKKAGFQNIKYQPLSFGIVTLYQAYKK